MSRAPTDTNNEVFDLEALAANTLGDEGLATEVLLMFNEQMTLVLTKLNGSSDPDEWGRLVHTLKGSARGVGACEIARVCETIEGELQQQSFKGWSKLEDAIMRSRSFISGRVG
ncbi:MAG: Hpt domain-containing protein [Rhodobacteraceae bacterium]|nr:Hpt domain-containing protein [Paracoccaceae bacterium]